MSQYCQIHDCTIKKRLNIFQASALLNEIPEIWMICDDLHNTLTVAVVIVFTRHTVVVIFVRAERFHL